jgi:hypothetical protein
VKKEPAGPPPITATFEPFSSLSDEEAFRRLFIVYTFFPIIQKKKNKINFKKMDGKKTGTVSHDAEPRPETYEN